MVVNNPNKKGGEVEKKSSFISSLLGFFYKHTKKILSIYLSLLVISAFVYAFIKKLDIYKAMRFEKNPLVPMFIGVTDAIFLIVQLFVPVCILLVIVKLIMIKLRKAKLKFVFRRSFKRQTLIAFLVAFAFSVLFYYDVLLVTKHTPQLIKSSIELFILFFISILFTISSLYGVIRGISPVVEEGK